MRFRDTIVTLDDAGVTFRSVYDGAEARLSPSGSQSPRHI